MHMPWVLHERSTRQRLLLEEDSPALAKGVDKVKILGSDFKLCNDGARVDARVQAAKN